MKTTIVTQGSLLGALLLCAAAASAETIMYNGYPRSASATYFKGFTIAEPLSTMRPSGVSNMMKNTVKYSTLSFPSCFADAPNILPLRGGENDASLYVADASGGAFSGQASGAKLLKLSDNCQARTGSLHFRVLLKAEQGVLDALTSDGEVTPTLSNGQTCGLFWTVPDYFQGCADNSSLRLTGGLALSSANNIANKGIALNFVRALAFAFHRDSAGVALRLYVWGSETAALADAQKITLVDSVVAGETYVCYAKIDIGAIGDAEVIRAMAQPVSSYDRTAAWPGSPFPVAIRSNLIGGADASALNANLLVMGANKLVGKMQVDEACLTTSADEAVVFDAARVDSGVVIAYDGFPCGTGAYSDAEVNVRAMTALTTPAIYGFSDSLWAMNVTKDAPKLFGASSGLSLPALYAGRGISVTDGAAIGFKAKTKQPLMMYRTLTDGLLDLPVGTTLNMRLLLSVTPAALVSLASSGSDGALYEGTAGAKVNVNYVGAGLLSLPATKIESGDTAAPALSPRDNSCLFAFVKGSDGKVGLYLNLRETVAGAQTSHRLADVDASVGGTYLCFATIEVGAGANGAERIRAFGVNVNDVTEPCITKWVPADAGKDRAVECELIGASSYPKHLAVGGSDCDASFRFDEFALSVGDWYPLVWAKYPRKGVAIIVR